MMMAPKIIGMVLAGGRVDELLVLTAKRPKSALPIWGTYRIIDFALSNLMHAGIEVVGVLSQYRPYSLATHLANGEPWDYLGRSRTLRVLTPFQGASDSDWYKGTADALYQNLDFIERYAPDLVLVVSGDHIYSMDYRPMLKQHLASGADLTLALKRVPRDQAHLYGTAVLDATGRVVTYQEKAPHPEGDLASLTVYIFNTATLLEQLKQNAREGKTFQIYSEIIPRMVEDGARVHGWRFDGYWQYARTLDAYYAANMDILAPAPPRLAEWQVRTNPNPETMGDPVPAHFRPAAQVRSSLVCCNGTIEGTVERSILSPGVVIAHGAVVRDSVIMHRCRIEAGARVDRAVLDKDVHVGAGARVGCGEDASNALHPYTLSSGVTVVGKATHIPAGLHIGRGCVVSPDLGESDFSPAAIPSGTTVGR
jgi:glucose-1-phosphate adenylyltransferase